MLVHQLARGPRVVFTYSVKYAAMLLPRKLGVVADVDRGEHDALHLAASRLNRLHQ